MFQICLGISWGQPATPEAMTYMRNLLPPGCTWFAFGISLWQFPMVAQAVLLGGHPRVGMEDNIYLEKGKLAPSNAALVEKAGKIIQILGDEIATPADARQMLGIGANACRKRSCPARRPGMTSRAHGRSLLRRRVLAAGLRRVHALRAAFLVLEAGNARPGALVLVLDLDVQRAKTFGRQLDLLLLHEQARPPRRRQPGAWC